MYIYLYIYIYNFSIRVYVTEFLLNDWTDFEEMFCVCLSESLDGLDSQLDPVCGAANILTTVIIHVYVYVYTILCVKQYLYFVPPAAVISYIEPPTHTEHMNDNVCKYITH